MRGATDGHVLELIGDVLHGKNMGRFVQYKAPSFSSGAELIYSHESLDYDDCDEIGSNNSVTAKMMQVDNGIYEDYRNMHILANEMNMDMEKIYESMRQHFEIIVVLESEEIPIHQVTPSQKHAIGSWWFDFISRADHEKEGGDENEESDKEERSVEDVDDEGGGEKERSAEEVNDEESDGESSVEEVNDEEGDGESSIEEIDEEEDEEESEEEYEEESEEEYDDDA